jgi:flagellar motor protein MotB
MSLEDTYEPDVQRENYFVSMTDMMVGLVFIFIILLMYYALQFRDVTDQLTGADRTRTEILQQLQRSLKAKGVPVTIDIQNGVLRLPDAILFDSAHADLKPEGEVAVQHLAEALSEVLPCYTDLPTGGAPRSPRCPETVHRIESLYVEGHTDSDALSDTTRFKDNWDLSVARATTTYREITKQKHQLAGFCARKGAKCEPILSVSGYGPERPAVDGDSPDAKRSNRRIDLRIIMVTPDGGQTANAIASRLGVK